MPHDDADDPPELRILLAGSPEVVAARAMRMAFEVSKDQELIRGEVRAVGRRIDGVDASIQTLEKKVEATEKAAVIAARHAIAAAESVKKVDERIDGVDASIQILEKKVGATEKAAVVAARHAIVAAETVKKVDERIDTMQGEIMGALGPIATRLGIVETKKSTSLVNLPRQSPSPPTPSERPISYHDLESELERLMPKLDAKASDKRWLSFRDSIKGKLSEGLGRGFVIIIASIVAAVGLLIAGYAYHDCAHVIVRQGTSREIPKISPVGE